MLTALAALYWNDKRLPEQRAELYESILVWLLRSREARPKRVGEKTARQRLSQLALAMQTYHEGRRTQVTRRWAAEAFIAEEEVDSGVISSVGKELRFWHLTFQEYLAARELGGHSEDGQIETLKADGRIYQSEWRETVLLFAGVLYEQSQNTVDAFVSTILTRLGDKPQLAARARCVGLLGAMVQDLRPYRYEPVDTAYRKALDDVMAIFDPVEGRKINIRTKIDAADALALAGDPRFAEPERSWVTIPAGKFWMGAQKEAPNGRGYDPEADDDEWNESPVHEVELSAYQIGRYPITVGEYRRFVEDQGYEREELWVEGGYGESEGPEAWDEQLPALHPADRERQLARSGGVLSMGRRTPADGSGVGACSRRSRRPASAFGQLLMERRVRTLTLCHSGEERG